MRSRSGPEVLELCAGAGGQALGFEAAGFTHGILVDHDAHACASLRLNRPYWNVLQADIQRLAAGYWEGVDVVAAGLPCPPFSVAGRQLGSADDRNLFPAFLRIVSEVKPQVAVVENVRGLLEQRFSAYRERVVGEFAALGFTCHWKLLDAFDHGVPQRRARSFLVALRGSGEFRWPEANGGGGTVGEVLYPSMAINGWRGAEAWSRKANRPAPTLVGGSLKHGGPDLGPTRARRAWAELGVDGLGLADEAPGPGFRGDPRLTVEMASKLQSFPDDWKLAGGKTQRYRQVGKRATAEASGGCRPENQGLSRVGSKEGLREFLRKRVGVVVSSTALQQAAGGAVEWARRLRELREVGWAIRSHNDRADLKPGEYVLAEAPPSRVQAYAFSRPISKRIRAQVLERNGYTCQMCGAGAGDPDGQNPGRYVRLHVGHIVDRSHGGRDELSNLRALCSTCNQGAKNIVQEPPSWTWLLTQLRRASIADQRAALRWLQRKFGDMNANE